MISSEIVIEGLLSAAKWLDDLLRFGALTAATVIILRVLRHDELTIQGIKFKIRHYIYIAGAITLLHAFCALLFVQASSRVMKDKTEVRQEAWQSLTIKGPMLFR